jgi:hypothetical protein
MAIFWGLLVIGIYRYLPFLYQRTIYYLSGTEQKDWTSSFEGVGVAMLSTNAHVLTAEL